VAGGVYAAHRAKKLGAVQCAVETVGGVIGGDIGALIADVVEPGTSPWHRGPAHSCAAGIGILSLGDTLKSVESFCRQQADKKAEQRSKLDAIEMKPDPSQPDVFVPSSSSALEKLLLLIAEYLWRLAAGVTNGLAAGYISHLVLDAGTPRGLPMLA